MTGTGSTAWHPILALYRRVMRDDANLRHVIHAQNNALNSCALAFGRSSLRVSRGNARILVTGLHTMKWPFRGPVPLSLLRRPAMSTHSCSMIVLRGHYRATMLLLAEPPHSAVTHKSLRLVIRSFARLGLARLLLQPFSPSSSPHKRSSLPSCPRTSLSQLASPSPSEQSRGPLLSQEQRHLQPSLFTSNSPNNRKDGQVSDAFSPLFASDFCSPA